MAHEVFSPLWTNDDLQSANLDSSRQYSCSTLAIKTALGLGG